VWLNVIGWSATAVFSSSYFFKEAATLRRIQAAAASLGAIRSGDPFGTDGRRQPDRRRHRCDFHFAAFDLESPSSDESMTDLWQGCHVAFWVLISKSLIEINRFIALDS